VEETIRARISAERRAVLSSLWTFVLFNMLFRDIHEFARPGAIEEFMSMSVDEGILLASGVSLTVFISLIVLSRVLPYRAARWANLTVSIVALGGMSINAPNVLDDIWFLVVEAIGLLAIIWLCWTWRPQDESVVATGALGVTAG
jgi:hypothetical protein